MRKIFPKRILEYNEYGENVLNNNFATEGI